MVRRRTLWMVATWAVAAGVAAVPAVGGPPIANWSEPASLSSPSQGSLAAVGALDSRGEGVVFWNACTRVFQNAECPTRYINQARAFRGGSFERTRLVSRGEVLNLDVEARDGRATAHWQPFPRFVRRESTAQIGNRWSAPRLSRPPEGGGASVAYNAGGQAFSAYFAGGRGSRTLVARYRRSATAPWGPPRLIARAAEEPGFPTAVIDRNGRATVVWAVPLNERTSNDDAVQLKASTRRGNGTYVTSGITPRSFGVSDPSVGWNARGDIVVAYLACRPSIYNPMNGECATLNQARASVRSAGARTFHASRQVSPVNDGSAGSPQAVMNSARRGVIVYRDGTGLRAATASRTSAWSIETLTGSPQDGEVIETNGEANGAVAWIEDDAASGKQAVMVAPFGPEGTFGPAAQVSDPAEFSASLPSLALSSSGRSLLIWQGFKGFGDGVVRYSVATLS